MELLKLRAESAHYYDADGAPVHEVENKSKGGMRPTTIRDAKKLGLYPSVTTVIKNAFPTPQGLINWKADKLAQYMLMTPRLDDESDDEFIQRVNNEYQADMAQAPDLGTEVHALIKDYLQGGSMRAYSREALRCLDKVSTYLDELNHVMCEVTKVSSFGFAGTIDLIGRYRNFPVLIDWKTQDTKGKKARAYDEWLWQQAAYSLLIDEPVTHINVVIPTDESEEITEHVWTEEEMEYGRTVFLHGLRFFRMLKKWPAAQEDAPF